MIAGHRQLLHDSLNLYTNAHTHQNTLQLKQLKSKIQSKTLEMQRGKNSTDLESSILALLVELVRQVPEHAGRNHSESVGHLEQDSQRS